MAKGRPHGAYNKHRMDAQAKAEELGIDPFEILLLFAANKWQALGYESPSKTMHTAEGNEYDVPVISPELRVNAAKDATNYILAKKKSLEFEIKELPDEVFDQEAERRVHLKILKGELKASDVG